MPSGSSSPRKSAKRRVASPEVKRVCEQACTLIELMLQEMRLGMESPGHIATEKWDKLFGPKQSMVANIQKLVSALAALPEEIAPESEHVPQDIEVTPEELAMLTSWLKETRKPAQ